MIPTKRQFNVLKRKRKNIIKIEIEVVVITKRKRSIHLHKKYKESKRFKKIKKKIVDNVKLNKIFQKKSKLSIEKHKEVQ